MDFEKDNFEDETELSPLEEEELGGDAGDLVEVEEEELTITEEPEEEEHDRDEQPGDQGFDDRKATLRHCADWT